MGTPYATRANFERVGTVNAYGVPELAAEKAAGTGEGFGGFRDAQGERGAEVGHAEEAEDEDGAGDRAIEWAGVLDGEFDGEADGGRESGGGPEAREQAFGDVDLADSAADAAAEEPEFEPAGDAGPAFGTIGLEDGRLHLIRAADKEAIEAFDHGTCLSGLRTVVVFGPPMLNQVVTVAS